MSSIHNFRDLINTVEKSYLKQDLPEIRVGDTIRIGISIQEGDKKRVQSSEGIVISKSNTGLNSTITVRKIFANGGLERVFLIHSPQVKEIQVLKRAIVKKSKLYYLRGRSGKSARLKQAL
uniref:Large ribosomal subunit protein bL19c n=1 Tax=Haptophyceae sp. NIES-3900 TaxID=2748608 RepID=A0A7R7AKD6_9EUKA|nr:ribosomal protein L19 [Haptophyceae sp. NIES-3900]